MTFSRLLVLSPDLLVRSHDVMHLLAVNGRQTSMRCSVCVAMAMVSSFWRQGGALSYGTSWTTR